MGRCTRRSWDCSPSPPTDVRRIARGAGVVVVVLALGTTAWFAVQHDRVRAAWSEEAARLDAGDARYDAARSDRLYRSLLGHRADAALGAWTLWLGWGLLLGSVRAPSGGDEVRGRRAHLAPLIDALLVLGAIWVASQMEYRAGGRWAAWAAIGARALFGLAVVYAWMALARGRSLGAWCTGTAVHDAHGQEAGAGRGFAALLLLPFGVCWAPIALAVAPNSRPPHLRWVGLRATASHRSEI